MLSIETKSSDIKKDLSASLETYLSGAVKFIGNVAKAKAFDKSFEYADKNDFSEFKHNHIIAKDVINAKEKELNAAAKKYGLKEKANYFFDTRPTEADDKAKSTQNKTFALATGGAMAIAALTNSAEGVLGSGVAGAALFAAVKTAQFLSKAETPAEKKSIAEYAEIKHAQLALKQLKNRALPVLAINYIPKVRTEGVETDWTGDKVPTSAEFLAAGFAKKGKDGR